MENVSTSTSIFMPLPISIAIYYERFRPGRCHSIIYKSQKPNALAVIFCLRQLEDDILGLAFAMPSQGSSGHF